MVAKLEPLALIISLGSSGVWSLLWLCSVGSAAVTSCTGVLTCWDTQASDFPSLCLQTWNMSVMMEPNSQVAGKIKWVNISEVFGRVSGTQRVPQSISYHVVESVKVKVLVAQFRLTLCDPMNCSPPGSSVHGILQAGILERVAVPFSRGSSPPRKWTWVSCSASRFFIIWATVWRL